jgi:hypothetical protein
MDKDLEAPCTLCTGYSNYVKGDVYMSSGDRIETKKPYTAKPLKEAIDEWYSQTNGVGQEDFWVSYKGITHDPVEKPKHYMLFPENNIEVRDVIEQLVKKIEYYPEGMFIADYVQMMQYLMRFMDKNGVEDLKKARWYLDKMITAYDEYHL